ncbi:MAG: hypothetical protein SF339_23905 [Blastocatellia bacterium]|nr:hypothetical protein [Blastocatellia bacterium]
MSKRNGDRARFNREHKKRLLRRERSRALRHALPGKPAAAAVLAPNVPQIVSPTVADEAAASSE